MMKISKRNRLRKIIKGDGKKMGFQLKWLGQAGFQICLPNGKYVVVDPYLSNTCMELVGYKRIIPAPVAMEELQVDELFISHEHPDHLDTELYKVIQEKLEVTVFGSAPCKTLLKDEGLNSEKLNVIKPGDVLEREGYSVQVMQADHGQDCPGALGFLFHVEGKTIYFAGDTAYTPELLQEAYEAKPDIALLPINGMYGNLGSKEAARLAAEIGCKMVIPCHFWMFVEHGSNPLEFTEQMKELAPQVQVCFLSVGEEIEIV